MKKIKIKNYETYCIIIESFRKNNIKCSTETKFSWFRLSYFWEITINN